MDNIAIRRGLLFAATVIAVVASALVVFSVVEASTMRTSGVPQISHGSTFFVDVPADALPAASAARPIVVLDPGHGGDELGAVDNGIIERDSNFDMALRVRSRLLAAGVEVVLTRNTNGRADGLDTTGMDAATETFADLQARVTNTDAVNADVFLSLHSNYVSSAEHEGVEAYYNADRPFSAGSEVFAQLLRDDVVAQLSAAGYPVPASSVQTDTSYADAAGRLTPFFVLGPSRDVSRDEFEDRGVDPQAMGLSSDAPAYDTGATDVPGALLELLYLSNPQDAALLRDDSARDAMAEGIARAILTFLESGSAGSD